METIRSSIFIAFIYGVLAFLLILFLKRDFRPAPIYTSCSFELDTHKTFLTGSPLSVEFEAPYANINGVFLAKILSRNEHELFLRVENLSRSQIVAEMNLKRQDLHPRFPPANQKGDRMRITIQWIKDQGPKPISSLPLSSGPISVGSSPIQLQIDRVWATEIAAPEAPIQWIDLSEYLVDSKTKLEVKFTNLSNPKAESKKYTLSQERPKHPVKLQAEPGDQIQIQLLWKSFKAPTVRTALQPTTIPLKFYTPDNKPCDPFFFILEYDWPSRNALWAWLPSWLLAIFAFKFARLRAAALIALSLCALTTSVMLWQHLYGTLTGYFDPDSFGRYGELMLQWLRQPESRAEVEAWMDIYRYAWLPFLPALMTVLRAVDIPLDIAYLLLTSLPSFGSLLVVHAMLRRHFQLTPGFAFAGTCLFLCHHLFLASYAKPSTDPLGYFILLSCMFLISERFIKRRRHANGWLFVMMLLGLFTRPTGLLFVPFASGMAVIADWWRNQEKLKPNFKQMFITVGQTALPCALIFLFCFWFFDWRDNFKPDAYTRSFATKERFVEMLLATFLFLPLLWVVIRPYLKHPTLWMFGLWCLYFFCILIVVRPAYVTRVFLPVEVVAIVPSILALYRLWQKSSIGRGVSISCFVVYFAFNIGVVIYDSSYPMIAPWLIFSGFIHH